MVKPNSIDVTVIVALIAAIAAIVAPLITSILSAISARRLKAIELYFSAKSDAYKALLYAASEYQKDGSIEKSAAFQQAIHSALLFSSADTQAKIAAYTEAVLPRSFLPADTARMGLLYKDMILAMQRDLSKPRIKPGRRKKPRLRQVSGR